MSHNVIIRHYCVLKKQLNETTEVVRDIKRHQSEHRHSSTHQSVFTGQL